MVSETFGDGRMVSIDTLAPVAELTRRLPHPLAERIGWHVGQRASRVDRVARLPRVGRLVVDIGDYSHRQMYFVGEYEPDTTRLVRRLAVPGWTVLDVGANVGYFSLLSAAAGAPGARVVGFEPSPRLADMLEKSIKLNPSHDIRLDRSAVGGRPGVLPLHLTSDDRNSGLSSLRADLPDRAGGIIEVNVTTIDEYCATARLAPDLIKIDVEGYEFEVLQGAVETLGKRQPAAVICEITPGRNDPQPLIDLMRGHGYTPHSITEGGELLQTVNIDPAREIDNICFTRD